MKGQRLSWRNHLPRTLYREATFLPKRLVLVTLLLLALYLVLLVRTDQKLRHTALGFVEVSLQSKLVANYEQAEEPPAPFAPLRLEILRAKLEDENPYWSEAKIAAALQVALAAAAAPILQATPTPYPTTRMLVQADVVVHEQLLLSNATSSGASQSTGEQRSPTRATTVTPAVLAVRIGHVVTPSPPHSTEAPALADRLTNPSQPESLTAFVAAPTAIPAAITILAMAPALIPVDAPTPTVAAEPRPGSNALPADGTVTNPALPLPSLPTASNTPTNMPATHLAASQPAASESATPLPSATATETPAPTPTATASVAFSTPDGERPPSVPTVTATVTPLVLAPALPDGMVAAPPSPQITMTPLPTPTPTMLPTIAPTPTLSPTPTLLPPVSGLTAQVEAGKIMLQWATTTGAIGGYNLYRGQAMDDPFGERLNEMPLTTAGYVDTVRLDGRSYFYRVTAIDAQNQESPPSQAVMVTVADRTPPRTPSLLSLHLSGGQIQIRWQANTETDLAGYRLYRSTNWPVNQALGTLHGASLLTTPSYMDQVVLNGQTYYYIFTAVDQAGNESPPSIDAQMPTVDLTAPLTPIGLTATVHHRSINLTWQANSESDLAGYRLYRSLTLPVDITKPPIHSQPLFTTPFYNDEVGDGSGNYYYVLVAVDANQNSSSPSAALLVTLE